MTPSERHTEAPTTEDRRLLRTAVREGYFEVPRGISLVELAEQHDITDKRASERLRTALNVVVRDTVLNEEVISDG